MNPTTTNARGQALPLTAVSLMTLLLASGLALDAGEAYYYHELAGQAAASAALAGDAFLPGSLTATGSGNDALDRALAAAARNGFDAGQTPNPWSVSVSVQAVPGHPNMLSVTVSRKVPVFFLQLAGIQPFTVSGTALATHGACTAPHLVATAAADGDGCTSTPIASPTPGGPVSQPGVFTWTEKNPSVRPLIAAGDYPDYQIAYDGDIKQTVLLGIGQSDYSSQTWTWDGTTWTQLHPGTSPPPRYEGWMAYEPDRHLILLFGGFSDGSYLNDTWEWDGKNWSQLHPATVPTVTNRATAMAYDASRKQAILFTETGTWTWDGSNWTLVHPAHGPVYRYYAAMTYDAALQRVLLLDYYGVLWTWDGADWNQAGSLTSQLDSLAMTYDDALQSVVVFGGRTSYSGQFELMSGALFETFAISGKDPSQVTDMSTTTAPSGRFHASMAYDSDRKALVLWGGIALWTGPFNDTWEGTA